MWYSADEVENPRQEVKIRLAIRAWKTGDDAAFAEDQLNATISELHALVARVAGQQGMQLALAGWIVEIEFLDEPDPLKRFFRMGDPSRMLRPIAVGLM
jgi:hypothetical protein